MHPLTFVLLYCAQSPGTAAKTLCVYNKQGNQQTSSCLFKSVLNVVLVVLLRSVILFSSFAA